MSFNIAVVISQIANKFLLHVKCKNYIIFYSLAAILDVILYIIQLSLVKKGRPLVLRYSRVK